MSQNHRYLGNHFLMATPYLEDPRFGGSLTLICEHNAQGAMGLVINQPLQLTMADVLSQLSLAGGPSQEPVYAGGPVMSERGFVLHRPHGAWQNTLKVSPTLAMTSSRDILEAIAVGEGPADYLMILGYAGWRAGQLEEELSGNAWLTGPADEQILFSVPPEQRLAAAMKKLGVDPSHLSGSIGHA
ncbi:MAG: YqgE/AlgH family protein [Oleiphilaceae bacterium]|nr:YqgE/AlgH family protein [Oleiphilaceae bacterium]